MVCAGLKVDNVNTDLNHALLFNETQAFRGLTVTRQIEQVIGMGHAMFGCGPSLEVDSGLGISTPALIS